MVRIEQVQTRYDRLSDEYDSFLTGRSRWSRAFNRTVWGFEDDAYAVRVLGAISDSFEGRLLDIPVGTGLLTCDKYRRMKHARITCLDLSAGMLSQARERFATAGVSNVSFLQGDACALEIANESFDAVLTMNGFHSFSDKEAAFRETHRVLRTGGTFAGCFYLRGVSRRADFFVNSIYVPMGYFSPPFLTMGQLKDTLAELYDVRELWQVGPIAGFRCVKR